jgi:hypothetical protein
LNQYTDKVTDKWVLPWGEVTGDEPLTPCIEQLPMYFWETPIGELLFYVVSTPKWVIEGNLERICTYEKFYVENL